MNNDKHIGMIIDRYSTKYGVTVRPDYIEVVIELIVGVSLLSFTAIGLYLTMRG